MMKRLIALLVAVLLAIPFAAPALAYSYDDDSYPLFRVWTVVADNVLYMYPKATSSGNPISYYKVGTLLRVTDWYVYDNSNYCYAVGPDGKEGYVRKSCILRYFDYDDDSLAVYTVNSSYYENGTYRAYMYPSPSSSTDPVGVSGYNNGTKLKVVDWKIDPKYCYAVGPDGHCGFVRKEQLSYVSGTVPYDRGNATEYYWPGMTRNSALAGDTTRPTGGSSSGDTSGSQDRQDTTGGGTQGGSTLTPPAGYGQSFGGTAMNGTFTASASSYFADSTESADPGKAIDNSAYTSWDAFGEYEGAWIELTSTNGPRTVNALRIQNGNRKRQTSSSLYYYRYSRIKGFSLYVDGVYVMSGTLEDTSDWQNVALNRAVTGTSFRIYVDSVYQGTGNPYSNYGVSIAELLLI